MGQELITSVGFGEKAMRLGYNPELAESFGVDNVRWKVLTDAIFPAAESVNSIIMALTYCKARNLDVFKRPVHIVPMYSTVLKKMVDTVWPSISELRTTAFRTNQYAGKNATVWGPTHKEMIGAVEVEYPEWAQITVRRIMQGHVCEFVGPLVRWKETYATAGKDTVAPNAMWKRRAFGQLEKCAEAAALRAAFPEEIGNEYAAEEMEGQRIYTNVAADGRVALEPPEPDAETESPALTHTAASKTDVAEQKAPAALEPPEPEPPEPEAPSEPQKPVEPAKATKQPEKTQSQPAIKSGPAIAVEAPSEFVNPEAVGQEFKDAIVSARSVPDLEEQWSDIVADVFDRLDPPDQAWLKQMYDKRERELTGDAERE